MKDLREILLGYLREFNSHQVKEIEKQLEEQEKEIKDIKEMKVEMEMEMGMEIIKMIEPRVV